ncbi:hypothetical protein ACNQ13_01525 [Mycoplasma sp. VS428]|uniref:hypothetical protein n=1 Tax=Mycoplasma sp. VS428 TaxID=3401684 RepID=UPI003AAAC0F1
MNIKNKKQLEELKKNLQSSNSDIDWGDFSNSLMLYVIDDVISKINEINKLHRYFINEVKPTRINALNELIKDKNKQLKVLEQRLQAEQKLITPEFIKSLTPDNVSEVIFYDNNKKWLEKSIKLINDLKLQVKKHQEEILQLENSNEGFVVDENGKTTSRNDELQKSYKIISDHILNNLHIQISKEKLQAILSKSEEEQEDEFDF